MANYPALPTEFRLAITWLEQSGWEIRVNNYDSATNELFVEMRNHTSVKSFVQYRLWDQGDVIWRRAKTNITGTAIPITNPAQSVKDSQATMKRTVRRIKHQRRIQHRVTERVPPNGDAMDSWKERADLIKQLRAAEDEFLKNPDDLHYTICKALRAQIDSVEDVLVAEHE